MATAQLTLVSLNAKDIERTYRFYAAFGAKLRWHALPRGERCLLIDAGSVTLEFRPGDRYGKEPWVTVEFQVDAVYHCLVALQGEGYNPFCTTRTADDSMYASMMYTDPDGHIVRLVARGQDTFQGSNDSCPSNNSST